MGILTMQIFLLVNTTVLPQPQLVEFTDVDPLIQRNHIQGRLTKSDIIFSQWISISDSHAAQGSTIYQHIMNYIYTHTYQQQHTDIHTHTRYIKILDYINQSKLYRNSLCLQGAYFLGWLSDVKIAEQ